MNVLHVNSYYVSAPFYKNLYDEEQQRGLNLSVYVPYNSKKSVSNKDYGRYTVLSNDFNTLDRAFFFRKHNKILKNIEKQYSINRFDLIHAHSLFSNGYIAYKLYKKYNIPYIVAVRNTDVNIFFKRMLHLRSLGKEIINNAEKIIFISESYKQIVVSKYFNDDADTLLNKSIVIPNGINSFWLDNLNKEKSETPNNTINILSVGDIDKNKNHLATANACEDLISSGYDIRFNIVGRILNKRVYKKLLKYKFVNYLGTMKKEKLLDVYRMNDIFVMPSYTETFGLVYAEAMSQGLPVVYTKNQGFDRQFVEGMVGFHVNPNDSDTIITAIKSILTDYERITKNCYQNAKKFNWTYIAQDYISLYKNIS